MCDQRYLAIQAGQTINGKLYNEDVEVPCGKCPVCKKRRVNTWVFRLLKEEERSSSSYFITLTYNTKHVPLTPKGYMTLCKDDITAFWKALRKLNKQKIKYYLAGEYGTDNDRPHYHFIIFNLEDINSVSKAWTKGDIHIGQVSGASIAYTAKYIDKEKRIPLHQNDDRLKEYSSMSNGLGSNYLSPEVIQYHKSDVNRNYATTQGGFKIPLPRYYRDKIYNDSDKKKQANIVKQKIEDEENKEIRQKGVEKYIFDQTSAKRQRYKSFHYQKNNKR